jgi:nicotinamide-nucleotide amidase
MVGARITSIAGSSRYFLGGAIVYSNELKTKFADVPASVLAKHGAVSNEVAAAMAEGIREKTGSTLGLAITGVAGPGGGTAEKPVGLVYLAVSGESGTEVVERRFPGDRHRVQMFATQLGLDLVRRRLM